MRSAVLWIAGIELLLVLLSVLKLLFSGFRGDAAGRGMSQAVAVIATVVALVLLLPALALAWYGKLLWLALSLAVVAAVCVLALLVAG